MSLQYLSKSQQLLFGEEFASWIMWVGNHHGLRLRCYLPFKGIKVVDPLAVLKRQRGCLDLRPCELDIVDILCVVGLKHDNLISSLHNVMQSAE